MLVTTSERVQNSGDSNVSSKVTTQGPVQISCVNNVKNLNASVARVTVNRKKTMNGERQR